MPRQNRVTPFGEIIPTNARGTLMGNRGCLHDTSGNITKNSARTAWIICELEYNGKHRKVMTPGRYTELFFLDEATALTAGHRPCSSCARSRAKLFSNLWMRANPGTASSLPEIDDCLKEERVASSGMGALWESTPGQLPPGVFISFGDGGKTPWLWWQGKAYKWSPEGYSESRALDDKQRVTVLTPRSTVRVLREGYEPRVHPSVKGLVSESPRNVKSSDKTYSTSDLLQNLQKHGSLVSEKQMASEPVLPHTEGKPSKTLYKRAETPRGRELAVYFAGILRVTGMEKGHAYPLKKFLGNFSGHINAGRIEQAPGGYCLTSAGQSYFEGRGIPDAQIEAAVRQIQEGGAGWVEVK